MMAGRSLFYEDIEPPMHFVSNRRSVTDADFLMVSMMTGDWHPIHCDPAYAATTEFKRPIIGGVFGIMLFAGALNYWGVFEESTVAMLALEDWKFAHPIQNGDLLRVEMTISEKRLIKSGERGIIQREIRIINQDEIAVQHGRSPMMILRRVRKDAA
jgi:acyl dehydratase